MKKRKVIVIDALFPDPLFGAGFPRATQILNYFGTQQDISLHFFALWQDWSVNQTELKSLLPQGTETTMNLNEENIEGVLLGQTDPADMIWVSRYHTWVRISKIRHENPDFFSRTKFIYDSECIESQRLKLKSFVSGTPILESEFIEILENEMCYAREADIVIAVNAKEQKLFHEYGCGIVEIISHVVSQTSELKPVDNRFGLLFVGRLVEEDSPNTDSINWFALNCYPELLSASITCRLVGRISPEIQDRYTENGFEVSGSILNLQPLYDEAKLFIAPTRFAAGIPIKVIEAAAAGVPILATSILCEQLGWIPGKDMLVADSAQECIEQIRKIHEDDELWYSIQRSAQARVKKEFSITTFEKSVNNVLNLLDNIE
jgi:glycosyltransferase involved in cell wall biosynthesis